MILIKNLLNYLSKILAIFLPKTFRFFHFLNISIETKTKSFDIVQVIVKRKGNSKEELFLFSPIVAISSNYYFKIYTFFLKKIFSILEYFSNLGFNLITFWWILLLLSFFCFIWLFYNLWRKRKAEYHDFFVRKGFFFGVIPVFSYIGQYTTSPLLQKLFDPFYHNFDFYGIIFLFLVILNIFFIFYIRLKVRNHCMKLFIRFFNQNLTYSDFFTQKKYNWSYFSKIEKKLYIFTAA